MENLFNLREVVEITLKERNKSIKTASCLEVANIAEDFLLSVIGEIDPNFNVFVYCVSDEDNKDIIIMRGDDVSEYIAYLITAIDLNEQKKDIIEFLLSKTALNPYLFLYKKLKDEKDFKKINDILNEHYFEVWKKIKQQKEFLPPQIS